MKQCILKKFLRNNPWLAVSWNDIPWKKSLMCRITGQITKKNDYRNQKNYEYNIKNIKFPVIAR